MTDDPDAGRALCAPFLAELPIAGISISVMSERGSQSTIGTSDRIAARLEELQFRLGEGPTRDVLRSGRAALVADLVAEASRRWPVFGSAALDIGARGLFSFPMLMGPVTVGVVSLYALVLMPPWPESTVRTATGLATAATRPAIDLATRSADAERRPPGVRPAELRREVHQACGMLTVQLDCSIDEAMSRLRAFAFAAGRSIDDVARSVVARTLDFAELDD